MTSYIKSNLSRVALLWLAAILALLVVSLAPKVAQAKHAQPTSTNLSVVKNGTSYDFTAKVLGSAAQSPDGTVEFVDKSAGDTVLNSVALSPLPDTYSNLTAAFQYSPDIFLSGDFDRNGITDLVTVDLQNKSLTLHRGTASGAFVTAGTTPIPVEQNMTISGGAANAGIVGDFNGDEILDIAMVAYNSDAVIVFLGNGDGTFTPTGQKYLTNFGTHNGYYPSTLTAADFDGDQVEDLAVGTGYGDLYIMKGDGQGNFTAVSYNGTVGGNWPTAVVAADFNNDGRMDVALTNSYNQNLNIFIQNSDGSFADPVYNGPSCISLNGRPISMQATDLDGDGNADLVIGTDSSNKVSIFYGIGDGTFNAPEYLSVGQYPQVRVGDINEDGKPDVMVATDTTIGQYDRVYCLKIFINAGERTFNAEPYIQLTDVAIPGLSRPVLGRFTDRRTFDIVVESHEGDPVVRKLNLITRDASSSAQLTGATFSSGTHTIEARYVPGGNSGYTESTSNTVDVEGGTQVATTTTLVSSSNSSKYGDTVAFTATVTATSGTGTPVGTVEFSDGTTVLGTATLNGSGVATASIATLTAGTHFINAVYAGNDNYGRSSSPAVEQTVAKANSTTTVSSAKVVVRLPGTLVLNATVASTTGTPTGSVTFTLGTTPLGAATLDSAGKATLTVQTPPALGKTSVTATYGGDANYSSSESTALKQYVFTGPPTFQITGAPTTLTLHRGESGRITLTLTSTNGYDGTVSLGCTGLALGMACQFNPTQLVGSLDGDAVTGTLMFTTTGPVRSAATNLPRGTRSTPMLAFWSLGIGALGLVSMSSRVGRKKVLLLTVLLIVGCTLVAVGCGSTGNWYHTTSANMTPTGTTTMVVTAGASASSDGAQVTNPNQQLQLTITVLE